MPKMIQGKNAEMEKQCLLQNVENIFGQIGGQTLENVVNSTLKVCLVIFLQLLVNSVHKIEIFQQLTEQDELLV
jgi:hypothetical protein